MKMLLNMWLSRSSSYDECFVKLLFFVFAIVEALSRDEAASWNLEAAPQSSWVLLESSISVNCLNFTSRYTIFASDIRWFKLTKNGTIKELPISLNARVRSNGHQLQIFNAEVDDEGLYCCIPTRNVHSLTNCKLTVANLSIARPPVIGAPVKYETAKVGDAVILQCHIAFVGKPAAVEYSWQKFGKNLALQQPKYTTENLTDLFILIIHDATETDEGLYGCFLFNTKYQRANESIYLQVSRFRNDSSKRCDESINTTLFVGLHMGVKQNCNHVKTSKIGGLITAFVSSLCNCTELCVNVNIFNCLNVSMAAVKISLQGTKAPEIYDALTALLQAMDVRIQDSNYFLTCLSPWCNRTNDIMSKLSETPLESNCNAEIFIFCLLVILILLNVAVIIKCYNKRNQLNMTQQTYCFHDTPQPTARDKKVHYLALTT